MLLKDPKEDLSFRRPQRILRGLRRESHLLHFGDELSGQVFPFDLGTAADDESMFQSVLQFTNVPGEIMAHE